MRLVVLMLALLAAGCTSATLPHHALTAETRLSRSAVQVGDTVMVSVVVTNHARTTVRVATDICPEQFVVTDMSGAVVGPGEKLCAAISTRMQDLAPGEVITITTAWGGDALAGQVAPQPLLLAPGSYRVHARVFTSRRVVEGTSVAIDLLP